MRTLIIGGTGILSRSVATKLAAAGLEVYILTDGKGTLPEPLGIKGHLRADRNYPEQLRHAIESVGWKKWDVVIDCVGYNAKQARDLYDVIGRWTAHIMVVSTAIIYDKHSTLPIKSDSRPASAEELGDYGLHKVEMERFWREAWKNEDVPITIFRLPHILGVGSELGIVPMHNRDPLLLERIRHGHPLILADGGRQVLQFVFADDVSEVMCAAALKELTYGKTYNCAHPEPFIAAEYYREIGSYFGLPVTVLPIPSEAIWRSGWGWGLCTLPRVLSMEALHGDIGCVPRTSLSTSLRTCLDFFVDAPSRPMVDDGLLRLAEQIRSQLQVLFESVEACEPKRIRTAVDIRMNTIPPRLR